jgi:hypothetical protein
MTKEEQVVGLIFQVTMWAYVAAAAAYVVTFPNAMCAGWFRYCFAGPGCQRRAIRWSSVDDAPTSTNQSSPSFHRLTLRQIVGQQS